MAGRWTGGSGAGRRRWHHWARDEALTDADFVRIGRTRAEWYARQLRKVVRLQQRVRELAVAHAAAAGGVVGLGRWRGRRHGHDQRRGGDNGGRRCAGCHLGRPTPVRVYYH